METVTFKKLLDPPGAFGAVYLDVTRPGHLTTRFKFDGDRGETKEIAGLRFYADLESAKTALANIELAAGFEVLLVGELDLLSFTGVLGRARLVALQAVSSSDPTVTHMLHVAFPFTRTGRYNL